MTDKAILKVVIGIIFVKVLAVMGQRRVMMNVIILTVGWQYLWSSTNKTLLPLRHVFEPIESITMIISYPFHACN